jgi:hypothetical protein
MVRRPRISAPEWEVCQIDAPYNYQGRSSYLEGQICRV